MPESTEGISEDRMTLQVLVATMHQTDHSLLEKMNIQSDAIVVNQCNRNEVERFMYNGHQILWMPYRCVLYFKDEDIVEQEDIKWKYGEGQLSLTIESLLRLGIINGITYDNRDDVAYALTDFGKLFRDLCLMTPTDIEQDEYVNLSCEAVVKAPHSFAARNFAHLYVVSGRQRSVDTVAEMQGRDIRDI